MLVARSLRDRGAGSPARNVDARHCNAVSSSRLAPVPLREDFDVQQLIPELRVQALAVAVLPWAARLDVERLHADPAKPLAHISGDEFGPVIGPEMLGRSVCGEQVGEASNSMLQLVFAYPARRVSMHPLPNVWLGLAVGSGVALQVATVFLPPLRTLLGLAPIGATIFGAVMILVLLIWAIAEYVSRSKAT